MISTKEWKTPEGEFFWGSAQQVKNDPLNFYLQAQRQHGDYLKLRATLGFEWYFLTNPTAVEHVLQTNQKNFRKPDLFMKPASLMLGNGLLTSEGSFWVKHRRLSQPAFHRNSIAKLASTVVECSEKMLSRWDNMPDGSVVDLQHEMIQLTLSVAGRALFSIDLAEHATDVGRAVREAFAIVNAKMFAYPLLLPLWVPTAEHKQFKHSKEIMDSVFTKIISERRKDTDEHNDLLGMLMSARDEETGTGMTDDELKDEVVTLLIAGHDTVAAALSWTWILLAQNPHVRSQLHDELKASLDGRSPSLSDLEHLPYVRMIFDESLRLYPPAWGQPRQAIDEDLIDGYLLPKNAIVSLSQWVTHRHAELWDKPDVFDPERFTPDKIKARPKFAYFPFGGGSRVCIGQNFALMEAQLAIATIGQRYQIDLVEGQSIVPDPTFTLIPKGIVSATLRRR